MVCATSKCMRYLQGDMQIENKHNFYIIYHISFKVTIVNARPRFERWWKDRRCRHGPLFNHRSWQQLPNTRGLVEGPISIYDGVCSHGASGALSLSIEEGRSTFGVMARVWAKFQVITKGEWSCHQSLGFSKVLLNTFFQLILLPILG